MVKRKTLNSQATKRLSKEKIDSTKNKIRKDFSDLRSLDLQTSVSYIEQKNKREKDQHKLKVALSRSRLNVSKLQTQILLKDCQGMFLKKHILLISFCFFCSLK